MGQEPFPRNQRCPCGSDKKYKHCCYTKGFHYYIDRETGEVSRSVPVSPDHADILKEGLASQRKKFIEKFGREPGPDDKIFFDLDEEKHDAKMVEIMRKVGVDEALIYAYEKTGLIVTAENRSLIPDVDLEEFAAAVDEYYELHPDEDASLD